MVTIRSAASAAALLLLGGAAHAQPTIHAFTGGSQVSLYAMSPDGSVVGGSTRLSGASAPLAFRWSLDSGLTLLEGPNGPFQSRVRDIDASGQKFVGGNGLNGGGEAFRWQPPADLLRLGFLPTSFPNPRSEAIAISHDGTIIVGESGSDTTNTHRAFRWTQATGMVPLGTLPGGQALASSATGISSDGQVIAGSAVDHLNRRRAYRWTAETGMTALPGLPGDLGNMFGQGISPDGQVIFGAALTTSGDREPYRWSAATGTQSLGGIDKGPYNAFPRASNADGSVIVGISMSTNEAFIWDEVHYMRPLRQVLIDDYGMDLTGWNLLTATAISADGMVIAGEANVLGMEGQVGFVVYLPAPGTALLLGLAPLGRRRRRPVRLVDGPDVRVLH